MTIKAVYDTGSNVSLINQRVVDILKSSLIRHNQVFKTINGFNFCSTRANILMKIGNITNNLSTYIMKNDNFSYDLLLGLDAIKKFKLLQNEDLDILQKVDYNKIIKLKDIEKTLQNKSPDYFEVNLHKGMDETQFQANLCHISDKDKKEEVVQLIEKYRYVCATGKFDVGRVKSHAEIKLIKDEYVSSRPYKCSIPDEKEITTQVKKLLEVDLIEESESPYASPVTLAFKKEDGCKSRLCIDFRKLNKLIVPESFYFPTINDIIDKIPNCKYFTVIDINSAFWCIPLKETDREKTSFITKCGTFQFKVLPFGLKNAPAIFQRTLANIIRRHNLDEFCINYIDDILLFSRSWDDHILHISKLLQTLSIEGFKIKLSKCKLASESVKYLGHFIQYNKISPAQENLVAITKLQRPVDKSGVRSILGSINFYLRYIENSSVKFEPLHRLLKKNVEFKWTDECEKSFQLIKDYLCSSPILAIFDIKKDIFIETDASYKGLGAALKQPQEGGKLHPVAYFSRKLSDREKKMDVIHLECKAIKDAIKYWQYYLIGRKFFVCSDHKPLENLRTKSRTDEILGDMVNYLTQFNFNIIYRKGKENVLADHLSRYPVLEYFENEEVIQVVNLIELDDILNDQKLNIAELQSDKRTMTQGNMVFKTLKNTPRIFVSVNFGKHIIELVHETFGHIGVSQMLATIRPYYYFKNLDSLVADFCKKCSICTENKTRRSRTIGLMSKLGPAREPFEIMSIDTVGGLRGNRSKKRFMHILVDHFTRYTWISTSKTQGCQDFIHLVAPIAKENKIKIILADQYTGINSEEFKDYLNKQNTDLIFTCIDCPQSNGLNERLNQTLINRMRCKINSKEEKRAWPVIAQECVAEYNNTIHSATKFTPAYLLFGKMNSICPFDYNNQSSLTEDKLKAFQNSMENFNTNKSRVDQHRTTYTFKTGDLVYIENGNKLNRNKLDKVRIGPYKIIRRISPLFYEVDSGKRKKISNYFHANKLSLCESAQSDLGGEGVNNMD